MNNFKNNYSELLLLANEDIIFRDGSKSFKFVPMSVRNIFFNEDLGAILSFFDTEIEDLKKSLNLKIATTHYQVLLTVFMLGLKREEFKEFSSKLFCGLRILLPEIEFKDEQLWVGEILLESSLFEEIIKLIFKILGKEKVFISEEDDEFTRMEKEAILRAERIRKNSKKNDKDSKLEDSLIALVYEYPQYKIEDLFDLNIYTFNYLFKYVGKIANYEVSKIAAGNGLAKKHKYFIEK